MTKSKKQTDLEQQVGELTLDLQRTRADFENFRKRVETEKQQARQAGKTGALLKLLPVVDTIERAILHMPDDLRDNEWAKGVSGLVKQLDKSLESLGLARIDAEPGTAFDPVRHEAIQFDEESTGTQEVVSEELQAGYTHEGTVIRPALVKAARS